MSLSQKEETVHFLFTASASWNQGYVNPSGGRDSNKRKRRVMRRKFTAVSISQARLEAAKLLLEFKLSLPKRRTSSLVWNSGPKIMGTLARVEEYFSDQM